jgi:peptidoglycan/LPS O-acetylase OafA/YrhL
VSKSTSLYLDLVRALAALLVLLEHAGESFFSRGLTWPRPLGHEMVIIFFVLSGFVIAYAASKPKITWRSYAADRLSRLYSVLLPALLLTTALDHVGWRFDPDLYISLVRWDHYAARMLLGAGFLTQSWHWAVQVGSNGPLWTLAYEFWYYFFFGGLVFARGWWRSVPILAFLVVTGYKIVLLLPIWMLGVGAFEVCRRRMVSPKLGMGMAIVSLSLVILAIKAPSGFPVYRTDWQAVAPLFFSTNFVEDYFLSILIAANFVGTDAMLRSWSHANSAAGWVKVVRYAAGRSFSIYVFHFPILVFCRAIIPFDPTSSWQVAGVLMLVILLILLLSEVTEQRREPWRRFFRVVFGLPARREPSVAQGSALIRVN